MAQTPSYHQLSSHIYLMRCSDALQIQLTVVGSSIDMFYNLIQGRISLSLSYCLASLPNILQMMSRQFILFIVTGLTSFFFLTQACFLISGSFFNSDYFTISGCFTISGFLNTSGGCTVSGSLMGSFSMISVIIETLDSSIKSSSSSSTMKTLHPAPSVFNLKRLASSLIQIFSSYFMKKNLVSYGNSLKAFFTFSTNMLKVLIDDTTIFLLTPLY